MFTRFVNVYDSSNISQVGYDPVNKQLRVSFKSNNGPDQHWLYEMVPARVFGELVSAISCGKFWQAVKNNYKAEPTS